ncbi:FAD-binding protein [Erythrobacter crassostreae]|uniref:FAD-binding protein n=1 Tax=Erythrobacter crassostreae TaxID=2828328 RepID=A0A9X1F3V5_9SPHN|nr:FAD-binding protein [Erythrobacter crassostrea]MBV7258335.1 FAD-binding protein [Erythrobacter crassostrea]
MGILDKVLPGRSKKDILSEKAAERIHSWMKVFFGDVYPHRFTSDEKLADFIRENEYSCVGQSHSYNGVQVVPGMNAVLMGKSTLDECDCNVSSGTITCGPSTTIEELKRVLLEHDLKMFNSGNYMAQTVIGALVTGTHGYGEKATMADGITELTFLNGRGMPVTLKRGDPDFPYAAISFGTIGPIISVTLEATELVSYQSDAWITRLSKKDLLKKGSVATSWAVVPYSDPEDPLIMLHSLRPASEGKQAQKTKPKLFSWSWLAMLIIERYWAIDRMFPRFRRPLQRLANRLNIRSHRRTITDKRDLDYLYDPEPLLKSQRSPDILTGLFSTTHTAYNLAFHVPLDRAEDVVKFIMIEVEKWQSLRFYMKSLIGVRELSDKSSLPLAGNFRGPTAAIDLFADTRDYAWLERLQREVLSYFDDVRPHWGKSAIVPEFAGSLGYEEMERLSDLHRHHYPEGNLKPNERVRKLFDLGRPMASASIEMVRSD